MRPIRVDVNLTWIFPGRVGGSEEYLTRQLMGLIEVAPDDFDIRVFCQPSFPEAHHDLSAKVDMVSLPFTRDWRGARIVAENSWLASHTRHADVVHHGGGTAPPLGSRSVVLTVHDLQYLEFPHYFSRARREYLARFMPGSVRRARLVAVPSEFVRGTVIESFGAPPENVVVVPHGIPPLAEPTAREISDARTRHGVTRDYVVYPAITHPHKGHRVLIDMLTASTATSHPLHHLQLVLVGGEGAAELSLQRRISEAGVAHRVVRTGRVTNTDRDALVAGAAALVFPSEYEGFGAPLVEAMALGTPVVASGCPAVREVCGGSAVIVGDATGKAWIDGVAEALMRSADLVAAGRERREAFTLATSGSALAAVYRTVADAGWARSST